MSLPNIINNINELEIKHNNDINTIKSTYLPLSGGNMTGDIIGKGGYLVLNNSFETGFKSTITEDKTCIAVRNSSHDTLPSMISLISNYGTNNAVLDITAKDNRIYARTPIDVGNNFLYFGHNGFSIRGWECPELENGCCHWEFRADDNIARYGGVYIANEEVPAGAFSKVRTEHNSDVIVERWQNGQSWFRKWSDGWIEQGGACGEQWVTFYHPFSNTNYHVILTPSMNADIAPGVAIRPDRKNTVNMFPYFSNVSYYGLWYACGY